MTKPTPRSTVLAIDAYVPGRSAAPGAARVFKLSANETPLGPSPRAIEALRDMAGEIALYPEGSSRALREAIGARYALDPDRIIAGAGSDNLLELLALAYIGPGDEGVYSQHGFLEYKIVTLAAGGTPVVAPETNYTAEVDALLACVSERTKIVFLANPNNPTGTFLPANEVARLARSLPSHVLLVLDAAYAEYVLREDYEAGVALVDAHENVVMTRTFSKIYGLAGLRARLGLWTRACDRRAEPHPLALQRLERRLQPRRSPRCRIARISTRRSRIMIAGCRGSREKFPRSASTFCRASPISSPYVFPTRRD